MVSPGETEEGGLAPLALRAHPPGYFGQDEGGAAPAAPLLFLRCAVVVAGLWLVVRFLPGLPDPLAAALVVVLGGLVALPGAWALAVRRGHGLGTFAAQGRLRPLLAGPVLRLALAATGGTLAAGLLLLRLVEAGPALWALAALVLPLTWALMARLARWGRTEQVGLHARRLVHRTAMALSVGAALALSLLSGLLAPFPEPSPFAAPVAAGPLVAEALALARLWAGLEAYALGHATEFGDWGRAFALLVVAGTQAAMFWAMAALAVALALPRREWRRALAPASDAATPPAMGWPGPMAAAALVVALTAAATLGGRWLGAQPPEARPAARVGLAVELIGDTLYRSGTLDELQALRAAALAEDAEAREQLRAALDAGFDAMAGNVDPFLDGYYSLSGEYGRLLRWAFGRLEAHMTAQLSLALQEGAPFAPYERLQSELLAEAEARASALAAAEAALLASARIDAANPARLLVTARHGPLPLPAELLSADLRRAELRWGAAAGTGVIAAAMARRVAAGLASRGLMATAARMLVRVGGLLVAFGVDYALVKLDEYQNRDEFRAAILAEIEAQRALAASALAVPAAE